MYKQNRFCSYNELMIWIAYRSFLMYRYVDQYPCYGPSRQILNKEDEWILTMIMRDNFKWLRKTIANSYKDIRVFIVYAWLIKKALKMSLDKCSNKTYKDFKRKKNMEIRYSLIGLIIISKISYMDLRVLRALFKSLKMRWIDSHIFI